jgi:hypothetical protein
VSPRAGLDVCEKYIEWPLIAAKNFARKLRKLIENQK